MEEFAATDLALVRPYRLEGFLYGGLRESCEAAGTLKAAIEMAERWTPAKLVSFVRVVDPGESGAGEEMWSDNRA